MRGNARKTAASYDAFLADKAITALPTGMRSAPDLPSTLFAFQRDVTAWALEQGRASLFLECGMGKTPCQLAWADAVARHTGKPVLILAPLAVSYQTRAEGEKFGFEVRVAREREDLHGGVNVTNYERLARFDPSVLGGVVLDESSILKSYMGATKRALLTAFSGLPFRLCCTATPAPNDHLELGNHSEFLGVLSSHEMIARWFLPDTSSFGTYELKGHAVVPFWDWVASWARAAGSPADLGFDQAGFDLPPLDVVQEVVGVDVTADRADGHLFRIPDMSATGVHQEKRRTAGARAQRVADLVAAEPGEQWLIWTDTDYEAAELVARIPEAREVRGGDSDEQKEDGLLGFASGKYRILITKPKLAGFGMNWQNCARVAFVGPSFSYEQFYQAVRRSWRFGQTRAVRAHVVLAATEKHIWDVVSRKADGHDEMKTQMFAAMRRAQAKAEKRRSEYRPLHNAALPPWLKTG